MTANHGYNQGYDLRHEYSFRDWMGPRPEADAKPNTLYFILKHNKDFSRFLYMVERAEMGGMFDSFESDFTLFVPSNAYLEGKYSEEYFTNMDRYTAIQIVRYHMLNGIIPTAALRTARLMKINTYQPGYTILVKNLNDQLILNECIKVVRPDVPVKGGLIHIIDGILLPSEGWHN
jgi:transforming growth factor-beta-induced protein